MSQKSLKFLDFVDFVWPCIEAPVCLWQHAVNFTRFEREQICVVLAVFFTVDTFSCVTREPIKDTSQQFVPHLFVMKVTK